MQLHLNELAEHFNQLCWCLQSLWMNEQSQFIILDLPFKFLTVPSGNSSFLPLLPSVKMCCFFTCTFLVSISSLAHLNFVHPLNWSSHRPSYDHSLGCFSPLLKIRGMKHFQLFNSSTKFSIFCLNFLVGRTSDNKLWSAAGSKVTAVKVCSGYNSQLSGFYSPS